MAYCAGTKKQNKTGTTGLLGVPYKVLEKIPQTFAVKKKGLFVHDRH